MTKTDEEKADENCGNSGNGKGKGFERLSDVTLQVPLLIELWCRESPTPPTLDQLHSVGARLIKVSRHSLWTYLMRARVKGFIGVQGQNPAEDNPSITYTLTKFGRKAVEQALAIGARRWRNWTDFLTLFDLLPENTPPNI